MPNTLIEIQYLSKFDELRFYTVPKRFLAEETHTITTLGGTVVKVTELPMTSKKLASNMTEHSSGGAQVLVSYETPVAMWREGGPVATEDRYSQTTQRHITKWLGMHGSGLTSSNVPRVSGDAFRLLCKHYEIS